MHSLCYSMGHASTELLQSSPLKEAAFVKVPKVARGPPGIRSNPPTHLNPRFISSCRQKLTDKLTEVFTACKKCCYCFKFAMVKVRKLGRTDLL